jgi:PAS domain S-box-containing protein
MSPMPMKAPESPEHIAPGGAMKERGMEFALRHLVEALPGLVWTALPDGRAEFLNRRWCEYTGLSLEQAVGFGWQFALHPEDVNVVLEYWRSLQESGQSGGVDVRLRRYDGQYRRFLFSAAPLAEKCGRVIKWCGTNTDIEERLKAQESPRAPDSQFRSIFAGLPVLVTLTTPEGCLELANRHVLEFFGVSVDELKSGKISASFHPEDYPGVLAAWRRSQNTGEPYDFEARQRRADGVYRWTRMRGFPLRDTHDQIVNWYFLQTDIEDTKRAKMALDAEKRFLELSARGVSTSVILTEMCQHIERLVAGCYCSILLVDPRRGRFSVAAGPSLPPGYRAVLEGRSIDSEDDPCSLAVTKKFPVIRVDVAHDGTRGSPVWPPLMVKYGLRSCWSIPILSGNREVLGLFAIYGTDPVTPTVSDQELIDRLAQIAGICIERAQADAALKASEAHLRLVTAHLTVAQQVSAMGSFAADLVGDEHSWSDEFYRICEFEPGTKITTQRLRNILHREDVRLFDAMIERAIAGQDVDFEFRIVASGGAVKHLHVAGRQANHRRALDHLTEAQRLCETGSFTADLVRTEHFWSDGFSGICDMEPGSREIYTETLAELVLSKDPPSCHGAMERAVAGEEPEFGFVTFRGAMKQRDIAHRIAQDTDRPMFVGAVQDVTESKLAKEALHSARAELAHVERVMTLGALTASIAHEVTQPLSGIIINATTCLSMLTANPPNLDGARATVQRALCDGNRASEVITRLRAMFARKHVTNESFDLNEAAREVLALSSSELQVCRTILRTDFDADLPPVSADRVQIQQVILNLILNAADAMRTVDDHPRNLLIVTALEDANWVRLSVRDSGAGINPQHIDKLFDAFFTTKPHGMGVGLSISRSIIESHMGRLWATANDGPGATFSLSIPCRPNRDESRMDPHQGMTTI